jgi:DNA-directed RNA polymerase specialized sigma24 family protein
MTRDDEPLGPFPATQWSLVEALRAGDEAEKRRVLGELISRYRPALRAYLVSERRLSGDEVEEVLQGFIAEKVFMRDLMGRADRAKGKMRTLLLTALQRYLIDRARAKKVRAAASLDDEHAAEAEASAGSDVFDVAWGREVLREALRRMKANCERWGRVDLWEVFYGRVVGPAFDGTKAVEYESLMPRFGWATTSQASNALVTAKRMFERELRGVIGEYARDEGEVEEELRDLRGAWRGVG